MNPDLARLVVIEVYRAGDALGGLVPSLKAALPEAEYKRYLLAIGSCLDMHNETLLKPMFEAIPGLEESVASNIEKFGRAF